MKTIGKVSDLTGPKPTSANPARAKNMKMSISAKLTLSVEQQKVLSLVVAEGKNIFFTGSAGKLSETSVFQH